MNNKVQETIFIIGSGAWGTAIATQMNKNHEVTIYCIENGLYNEMQYKRTNKAALPEIKISEKINISNNFYDIKNSSCIIIATPSNTIECIAKQIALLNLNKSIPVIIASKGIGLDGTLLSDILSKHLQNPVSMLAGPNIAIEIAQNKPSIAVIACKNKSISINLSKSLSSDTFNLVPSAAVISVQIAGCVKNIAATICGISNKIYNSQNLQACLTNRAVKEIMIIAREIEIKCKIPQQNSIEEQYNEAIIGDLILCCYSTKSRNNTFGIKLVQTPKQEREIFIKNYPILVESKENAEKISKLEKALNINNNLFAQTLSKILINPELLEQYIEYMINALINNNSLD